MFDVLRQFKFCSHIVIVTSNLPRARRKAYGNCQTYVKVLTFWQRNDFFNFSIPCI